MNIRRAAVAGTWYPDSARVLAAAVDRHLAEADRTAGDVPGDLVALIAPHAGLMYSGPVAAHAYRLLRDRVVRGRRPRRAVTLRRFRGRVHLSLRRIRHTIRRRADRRDCARAILAATPVVREHPDAHAREHSLEMQLPFLEHIAPGLPIVPLLMGHQTAATARALGDGLVTALRGRNALLDRQHGSVSLSRRCDRVRARRRRDRLRVAVRR